MNAHIKKHAAIELVTIIVAGSVGYHGNAIHRPNVMARFDLSSDDEIGAQQTN